MFNALQCMAGGRHDTDVKERAKGAMDYHGNHGNVTEVIFTVIFYETGLFDGILCEVDTGGGWSLTPPELSISEPARSLDVVQIAMPIHGAERDSASDWKETPWSCICDNAPDIVRPRNLSPERAIHCELLLCCSGSIL